MNDARPAEENILQKVLQLLQLLLWITKTLQHKLKKLIYGFTILIVTANDKSR